MSRDMGYACEYLLLLKQILLPSIGAVRVDLFGCVCITVFDFDRKVTVFDNLLKIGAYIISGH